MFIYVHYHYNNINKLNQMCKHNEYLSIPVIYHIKVDKSIFDNIDEQQIVYCWSENSIPNSSSK